MSSVLPGAFVIGVSGIFLLLAVSSLARTIRLLVRGVRRDATVIGFTRDGDGGHCTIVEFTALSGATHRGELSISRKTVLGDKVAIMYATDDPGLLMEASAGMYLVPSVFAFVGSGGLLIGSAILVGWIPVG